MGYFAGLDFIVGTLLPWSGQEADILAESGWLPCDGSVKDALVDIKLQPLYDVIGNNFGGSGNSNFKLPDLRGVTLRGRDAGRQGEDSRGDEYASSRVSLNGGNSGDAVGSYQADQMAAHFHRVGRLMKAMDNPDTAAGRYHVGPGTCHYTNAQIPSGAADSRPDNYCCLFIIKAF